MPMPAQLMRPLVLASWRARLQPIDPGWLDVIRSLPLLNTRRARTELSWQPRHTSLQALADLAQALTASRGRRPTALTSAALVEGIRRRFSGDE
jgi:hypothetical protein